MMDFLIGLLGRLQKRLIWWRWKRKMDNLIRGGLKIGTNVVIEPDVTLDARSPFLIEIGDDCRIANGVRILAHDATGALHLDGTTRLGRVHIKENVFLAENVIILPGVTIGPNVLVAAGSVVNKDIPPNSCVAGIPARFYGKYDDMMERHSQQIRERTVFDHKELYYGDNRKVIEACRKAVLDGDAYVKGFLGHYPYTLNYTAEGSKHYSAHVKKAP